MTITLYDPRPAEKLEGARKPPANHRLTARDWTTLRVHAAHVHVAAARCLGYHKRRQRSRWLLPDGRVLEVRGCNPNALNWVTVILPRVAESMGKIEKARAYA